MVFTLFVDVRELETNLSKLLERVMLGEEIIIAKANKPIARLVPFETTTFQRVTGNDAGKVIIAPDFDVPLPEFEEL